MARKGHEPSASDGDPRPPSTSPWPMMFFAGSLVNNSFAAPGAKGCGGIFSFLVDPFVNSIVGLPSPAGTNTAVLEGKLQTAEANAVRESE